MLQPRSVLPASSEEMTLKCPICRRSVAFGSPLMPFCSDRCKDADLGNWAEEKYCIPAPLDEDGIQKLIEQHESGEYPR